MDDRIDLVPRLGTPGTPGRASGPLRAHASFITVFIVSAALTALALTYIYSERFGAETTIFFKPANILKLSENQVQALGSPVPNTPFKVISQTLSGLAKSDSLLRQVVLDLSLQVPDPKTVSPIWYIRIYREVKDWVSDYATDAWSYLKFGRIITPDPVDKAIVELRTGIKVLNEDSYVFSLKVRGKTPDKAAAIANDLADRMAQLLHQDDRNSAEKQHAQLRKLLTEKVEEITALQGSIRELLASNNVASVQDEIERSTARYSQLELSRADTRAELSQQEARLAGLAEKVRQQAPSAQPLGPDDPAPRRQAGRLTAEEFSKLSAERLGTEINVGGLRARVGAVDQSLTRLDHHLKSLTQLQAEYDLLWQKLTSAKRDYTALRDALAEATIKGGDVQTELRVTSRATPSEAPISPIKIYHVGLAALVAAMLACGLAYVFDYFNVRLFLPRPGQGRSKPGRELEPATIAVSTS